MATVELTRDNFGEILANNDTVLVDFRAEWCGPCKRFGPIFEEASDKHPGLLFGKVDTEAQQELAGYFGIRSIPTLMVFRQKVLLFNQAGMLPGSALDQLIEQVGALDMAEVHRQIAEQEHSHSHDHDGSCDHGHSHDHDHKH